MPGQSGVFRNQSSGQNTKKRPVEKDGFSFGTVYANDLAKPHFAQITPNFPVGSMIVREKRLKIEDEKPQTIIAMVKREKGFNKKTNDWEFFMFDGADLALKKRETKGDCAKCHSQVKDSDFVFKTYLK